MFSLSKRWMASSTMSKEEFCCTESMVINPSLALILKTSVISMVNVCTLVDCTDARKLFLSRTCWISVDVLFLKSSKSVFILSNSAWSSDIFWWSLVWVWLNTTPTQRTNMKAGACAMFMKIPSSFQNGFCCCIISNDGMCVSYGRLYNSILIRAPNQFDREL